MKSDDLLIDIPGSPANTVEGEGVSAPVESGAPAGDTGWRLWPPSPKMQIAFIALGFGLFNLILVAIWAVVMAYRF